MFKKALLSSLVSVFLTISLLAVSTAFGEPTTSPPSGLASPTFGGLIVNGNANIDSLKVQNFYGLNGNMYIQDPLFVYDYIAGSNIYTPLSVLGGIKLDGKLVGAPPDNLLYLGTSRVVGDFEVDGNFRLAGSIYNRIGAAPSDTYPVNVSDDLSVSGKLVANSIGTYTVSKSSRVPLPYTGPAPLYATFSTRYQSVSCSSGDILIDCGTAEYTTSTGSTKSYNLVQKSITVSPSTNPNTCSIYMNNPTATVSYFDVYAICFNPRL